MSTVVPWLHNKNRDTRPPAQAPDQLTHVGRKKVEEVTFRVFDYNASDFKPADTEHAHECLAFEGGDSPAWIMVTGLHDTKKLSELLSAYNIHPLIQQDILNTGHQPKVDDFGEYLFITAKQICPVDSAENFDVQQFSMVLTQRVLLTFHEGPTELFDPVVKRLSDPKGKLRSFGVDFLAWALLDAIMDNYLLALDKLEDEVGAMDERLAHTDSKVAMPEIHALRAQTTFLYRSIRPMREVSVALQRSESPLLSEPLRPFIRDLYDHSWHAIETADHLREAVTAIREFYQANLAQRMNEVMKVLTGISTIFLPLSFLAGVYGMNFDFMPELHQWWGYPLVWAIFIVAAFAMLWYFRRKKWL